MNRRLLFFILIIVVGWLLTQPPTDPALRRRYKAIKDSEHNGIEGFGTSLGDI